MPIPHALLSFVASPSKQQPNARTRRSLRMIQYAVIWTLGVALSGSAAAEEGTIELSFDPPSVRIAPGVRELVTIRVGGVPAGGLAAFQLELAYNARRVEIRDPNQVATSIGISAFAPLGNSPLCTAVRGTATCSDPPWLLTATGREVIGTASVNAVRGRASIAYGTHGHPLLASGDGALALLELVGIRGGVVRLRVVEAIFADASEPPRTYRWAGPKVAAAK